MSSLVPTVWSYSDLMNFEKCPKYFEAIKEKRTHREPESDALKMGHEVHKYMENYVKLGKPVPPSLHYLSWMADQIMAGAVKVEAERQLALTDQLAPCQWRSIEVCWRGKADLVAVRPDGLWVVDWKSGKPVDSDLQLRLLALALLQEYPEQARVYGLYAYTSRRFQNVTVERGQAIDVVATVNPRLERLRAARRDDVWPENPGRHCRWCPVTSCRFNELHEEETGVACA